MSNYINLFIASHYGSMELNVKMPFLSIEHHCIVKLLIWAYGQAWIEFKYFSLLFSFKRFSETRYGDFAEIMFQFSLHHAKLSQNR